MTKKRLLAFFIFLGLGVFSFVYFMFPLKDPSYLRIPVVSFSPFAIPIIRAEIGEIPCFLEIDLGLMRRLRLNPEMIGKIKNKTKKADTTSGDVLGNLYKVSSFQIPSLRLVSKQSLKSIFGNYKSSYNPLSEIKDIILSEENPDYALNTIFWTSSEKMKQELLKRDAKAQQGALGWPTFSQLACCFDFVHSEIILGENMNSLLEAGCPIHEYIEIPFSADAGGIIVSVTTDIGVRPFLLDTGATYSAIKEELIPEENIQEIQPGIAEYTSHSFILDGKDLGKWTFRSLKISNLYTQFDGILGMDFFKKHTVCLDFENKKAYIRS